MISASLRSSAGRRKVHSHSPRLRQSTHRLKQPTMYCISRFAHRASSYFLSSHHRPQCHHHHHLLRCSLSTQAQHQEEVTTPFMAQYLTSSFSIPADQALKMSNHRDLARLKSPHRPDSVVGFLRQQIGLSDSQIRSLVLFDPALLGTNADKILRPRARALIDAGFTNEVISQLILSNPQCLCRRDTLQRLLFWRKFVGRSDEVFLKVIRRNRLLISFDIDKHVMPRVNLFKEFGLSDQDITTMAVRGQSGFIRSMESLRQILERTEELGFTRGSAMFLHGLQIVGCQSKETLERKVEFFKNTYGWSDDDCLTAFRKFPYILGYSEEKVKSTMDYLIRKVKLEPRSVAAWPKLLGFSLERRLVPRHHVMSILESKGLKNGISFFSAAGMTEKHFVDKFVLPYVRNVPGLSETYLAASRGKLLAHN